MTLLCEKNKATAEFVKQICKPKHFVDDVLSDEHSRLPRVDLFVAGSPCQPFSTEGNGLGIDDPTSGDVITGILRGQHKPFHHHLFLPLIVWMEF